MLGKAKKGIRESRYFKSVGLGIKTPRAAIDGTYVDRKCPWTGAPAALERQEAHTAPRRGIIHTIALRPAAVPVHVGRGSVLRTPYARVRLRFIGPHELCLTPRHLGSTGNVNIRGKLITGVIKTTKMKNTVIIRKDYLHYITKYNRFEKRHKNTPVHVSPAFRVKVGDEILVGQCRPISKTVRFNMLKMIRSAGGDKKGFAGM